MLDQPLMILFKMPATQRLAFSNVWIILNYLRTTLSQMRLNNLMVLWKIFCSLLTEPLWACGSFTIIIYTNAVSIVANCNEKGVRPLPGSAPGLAAVGFPTLPLCVFVISGRPSEVQIKSSRCTHNFIFFVFPP